MVEDMQIALTAVAVVLLFVFAGSAGPAPAPILGPQDYEPPRAESWMVEDHLPELLRECHPLVTLNDEGSPCEPAHVLVLCRSDRGFSVDSHFWKFDGRICRYGVVTKWPAEIETKEG